MKRSTSDPSMGVLNHRIAMAQYYGSSAAQCFPFYSIYSLLFDYADNFSLSSPPKFPNNGVLLLQLLRKLHSSAHLFLLCNVRCWLASSFCLQRFGVQTRQSHLAVHFDLLW
mmetsp:Transcript_7845/g.20400  ORF Transcript_7845/g.20400 Transcript_7845/m.20400 type:complete len:112 (-) Transcript_7845:620-955(-)